MSPEKIGRFEILGELARSASGAVYKALDPKKKRTVVLRTLEGGAAAEAERRRFLLDAKNASSLDSPNIASIYAGAEEDGLAFVVVEYVEGISLASSLASAKGFSNSEVIDITRQVCLGLAHAHAKGVFHRALKPANIVAEWDGTIKIMDFGCEGGRPPDHCGDEVHYMSPEQVQGWPLDAASNLFSWGAILYEMVTGQKAFPGDGPGAVRQKILDETPTPPHEVSARIHPGISQVIMKALSATPADRYQRGSDLVRDLENYRTFGQKEPEIPSVVTRPAEPPVKASPVVETFATSVARPSPRIEAASVAPSSAGVAIAEPDPPAAVAPPPRPAPLAPPSPPPRPSVSATALLTKTPSEASRPAPAPPARGTAANLIAKLPNPVQLARLKKQVNPLVYALGGVILLLVTALVGAFLYMRHQQAKAEAEAAARPEVVMATESAPEPAPPPQAEAPAQPEVVWVLPPPKRGRVKQKAIAAAVLAPTAGELVVNSVPEGALVQIDGHNDSRWATPLALQGVSPGPHVVTFNKSGFAVESRSVQVTAGNKAVVVVSLTQVGATALFSSEPTGASILVDGRDSGKLTPAQLTLERGHHTFTLRKSGYLDATTAADLQPGQQFQFVPSLKIMGDADDIRATGKLKKLFGGNGPENAARVQVRTVPRGAQIMFNQRMMDKATPAEFALGPGNYEITLTLTGYKPVRRTITVHPGAKLQIDQTLEMQ